MFGPPIQQLPWLEKYARDWLGRGLISFPITSWTFHMAPVCTSGIFFFHFRYIIEIWLKRLSASWKFLFCFCDSPPISVSSSVFLAMLQRSFRHKPLLVCTTTWYTTAAADEVTTKRQKQIIQSVSQWSNVNLQLVPSFPTRPPCFQHCYIDIKNPIYEPVLHVCQSGSGGVQSPRGTIRLYGIDGGGGQPPLPPPILVSRWRPPFPCFQGVDFMPKFSLTPSARIFPLVNCCDPKNGPKMDKMVAKFSRYTPPQPSKPPFLVLSALR